MHWKHSKFEILYLIVANCHTYDEAYRVLSELEEDRKFSIESALAESLRAQAKVVGSKLVLADETESKSGKLLAQCNIDEQKARTFIAQPCLDAAREELNFIQRIKNIVADKRYFFNYSDEDAHQMCQRFEWFFDLHWKSYNYMCSQGHAPYEHVIAIKNHPDSQSLLNGLLYLKKQANEDYEKLIFMSKYEVLSSVAKSLVHRSMLIDAEFLSADKVQTLFLENHKTKENNALTMTG